MTCLAICIGRNFELARIAIFAEATRLYTNMDDRVRNGLITLYINYNKTYFQVCMADPCH